MLLLSVCVYGILKAGVEYIRSVCVCVRRGGDGGGEGVTNRESGRVEIVH